MCMLCQLLSNLQPFLQPVSQFPEKTQGVNSNIVADMKKTFECGTTMLNKILVTADGSYEY